MHRFFVAIALVISAVLTASAASNQPTRTFNYKSLMDRNNPASAEAGVITITTDAIHLLYDGDVSRGDFIMPLSSITQITPISRQPLSCFTVSSNDTTGEFRIDEERLSFNHENNSEQVCFENEQSAKEVRDLISQRSGKQSKSDWTPVQPTIYGIEWKFNPTLAMDTWLMRNVTKRTLFFEYRVYHKGDKPCSPWIGPIKLTPGQISHDSEIPCAASVLLPGEGGIDHVLVRDYNKSAGTSTPAGLRNKR